MKIVYLHKVLLLMTMLFIGAPGSVKADEWKNPDSTPKKYDMRNPNWGCLLNPQKTFTSSDGSEQAECLFVKFSDEEPLLKFTTTRDGQEVPILNKKAKLVIANCEVGKAGTTQECEHIYDGSLDRLCGIRKDNRRAKQFIDALFMIVQLNKAVSAASELAESTVRDQVTKEVVKQKLLGNKVVVQGLEPAIDQAQKIAMYATLGTAVAIKGGRMGIENIYDRLTKADFKKESEYDDTLQDCDSEIPLELLVRIAMMEHVTTSLPTGEFVDNDIHKPIMQKVPAQIYQEMIESLSPKKIMHQKLGAYDNFRVEVSATNGEQSAFWLKGGPDKFKVFRTGNRDRCDEALHRQEEFNSSYAALSRYRALPEFKECYTARDNPWGKLPSDRGNDSLQVTTQ